MNRQSVHWSGARAARAERSFNSRLRRRLDTGIFRHVYPMLKENSTVLDLGAGTGFLSLELAAHLKDGTVIAVDESGDMLARLSRRATEDGLGNRIQIRRADAISTGLPESSVDIVLSANLLHEVRDPRAVLEEVVRVLRPGGLFVFQDFRDGFFWKVFRRFHSGDANGPLSVGELYTALAELGVDEIAIQTRRLRYIASGRKPNGTCSGTRSAAERTRAG